MNSASQNINFQVGLLHFAHLLVMVDGKIDEAEKQAILALNEVVGIPDSLFHEFEKIIMRKAEREIFKHGVELLNRCSDEEKLEAFVHLYTLCEADNRIDVKEVRLLLYSLKATAIEFEDVELAFRMKRTKELFYLGSEKRVA